MVSRANHRGGEGRGDGPKGIKHRRAPVLGAATTRPSLHDVVLDSKGDKPEAMGSEVAGGGVAMVDRLSLRLVVAALLGRYSGLCFMGGS